MSNPWTEDGFCRAINKITGVSRIISIGFQHNNNHTYAVMDMKHNSLAVEGVDRISKNDLIRLTEMLIQKLTAKETNVYDEFPSLKK